MIADGPAEVSALRARIRELEDGLAERDARIAERDAQIATLMKQVAQLTAEVQALREQMAKNSSNSSKPPSSDAPAARESRSRRKKKERKRGGQRGHKGHHRELVPPEDVTRRQDVFPESCRRCGVTLPEVADVSPDRHQVVDVPQVKAEVTELRMHAVCCPECGEVTRAALPAGVSWSPFGPRLVALNCLLTGAYRLSKRNAAALLGDLTGIPISAASICENERRMSQALAKPVEEAEGYVRQQPVKYCDATGWREGASRRQLFVMACALVTVFRITGDGTKRTVQGLWGKLKGILISDRAKVFAFWALKRRQVCWAHVLRAFVAFSERSGPSHRLGLELLKEAHQLFHWWHRIRDGSLGRAAFTGLAGSLRERIKALLVRASECGHRKTEGTARNLLEHFEALWTFVRDKRVEPTNNHSERELRHLVIWRKTSYATQSEAGTRYVERVMSTVATLRKQRRNVLEYLTTAYTNTLKGLATPSLLPASNDAT